MKGFDRTDTERLDALFRGARRVCVVSHQHPDGDALGSASALVSCLRSFYGADALAVVPDAFPRQLDFIAGGVVVHSENPGAVRDFLQETDLVVCVDLNALSRTAGLADGLKAASCPKVLIDHHLDPCREEFGLVFSETEISSASELLYSILLQLPPVDGDASRLPSDAALSLMAGMTTDTNNFANSVYPSTFRMASALLEAGVDRDGMLSRLYNGYRENRYRMMGEYLSSMKITPQGIAYMVLSREVAARFDLADGETEGFVNMPLGIGEVKASIFAKEDDGFFRISVRSKKGFSANRLAKEFFHGGGHECAAGGRLSVPEDVSGVEDAGKYMEEVSARFV